MLRLTRFIFGRVVLYSVLITSALMLFVTTVAVQNVPALSKQSHAATPLLSGTLTTDTWGIFDPKTGEVIAGNNLDTPRPIASVTKLFTAETVIRSQKKDEEFTITYNDVYTEGRAGKLVSGEQVTPYALLFPLLIESSNDAAEAIKRHLGSEYTESLESLTTNLSLSHTRISDASGLSPLNVSTVHDLSEFFAYLKTTHPHILDITQLNTYIGPRTGYINNNPAHRLETFRGGKQGYTDEAHRTFVGTFAVGEKNTEIGVVLLRSDDLLTDLETLLAYGKSLEETSDIMPE